MLTWAMVRIRGFGSQVLKRGTITGSWRISAFLPSGKLPLRHSLHLSLSRQELRLRKFTARSLYNIRDLEHS
jgi:hypothetical protein